MFGFGVINTFIVSQGALVFFRGFVGDLSDFYRKLYSAGAVEFMRPGLGFEVRGQGFRAFAPGVLFSLHAFFLRTSLYKTLSPTGRARTRDPILGNPKP